MVLGDTSNISIPSIFTTHTTAKLLTSLLPGIMTSTFTVSVHAAPASAPAPAPAPTPSGTKENGAHLPKREWVSSRKVAKLARSEKKKKDFAASEVGRDGLWITLTPTTMSSSPFFDTLLVLVISPLVTLSVVYGQWISGCFLFIFVWLTLPTALLLIRSMIRRRSWRAPKSVVARLPVRTYQSVTTTVTTPPASPTPPPRQTSTQLQPSRLSSRPASESLLPSPGVGGNNAVERPKEEVPRRSRYMGGAVECVVCLEEYVDGVSRVMKLPCGHEFHASCMFVPPVLFSVKWGTSVDVLAQNPLVDYTAENVSDLQGRCGKRNCRRELHIEIWGTT